MKQWTALCYYPEQVAECITDLYQKFNFVLKIKQKNKNNKNIIEMRKYIYRVVEDCGIANTLTQEIF